MSDPHALRCPCIAGIASSAQALEVKHWFPENPTLEFFPGKEIQTVFGIKNTGPDALNVSFAAASLASPYDASINVYNFTTQVRLRSGSIC